MVKTILYKRITALGTSIDFRMSGGFHGNNLNTVHAAVLIKRNGAIVV